MALSAPFLGLNQVYVRGAFCIFVLGTSLGYLGYGPDWGRIDRAAEGTQPAEVQLGQQRRIASEAQRQLGARAVRIITTITQSAER